MALKWPYERPQYCTLTAALAAAALLVVSSSYAAADTAGPSEKARYEYAESLYRQGVLDAAAAELTGFVEDYPGGQYTDDAYYWLGRYYMGAGRYKDGIDRFSIVLSMMPDGDMAPAAQYEIAHHWFDPSVRELDPERAMAEFLKIPFFYPESSLADDASYYAALCQAELGRYSQAAEALSAFISANPGSEYAAPAGYRLGLAYLIEGRTDEALAAFQGVRDSHPAGLMSAQSLHAIELVARARDKKAPEESHRYGGKGDAPGKFSKPASVACGPETGIYVADTGNSRVQKFKLSGGGMELNSSSLAQPTLDRTQWMDEPAGVAVGPDGRVYVLDRALCRVQVFTPEGALVTAFGRRGGAPGELSDPRGIVADRGGRVYVADRGNRRVSVFDPRGNFERVVGAAGASGQENALRSPAAVALDIRGNLLVADDSAGRVYGYDGKGGLVMFYEKGTAGGPALKEPSGIAVDAVGNIYVTETDRGVVVVFDRELRPLMEFGALDSPSGIAVTPSGDVYVSDSGTNQVVVFK